MIADKREQLVAILAARPQTSAIVAAVLEVWPEHAAYLLQNFQARSAAMLDVTEAASTAARKLMEGREVHFATDYRWMCDRLREEELFFHREGRYRLSTFVEADAEVYSNDEYMSQYVNGLLLSQMLWYNHIATLGMFLTRVLEPSEQPFDYLEIGPGHGLMFYFAATNAFARSLEAWDVSAVSLKETRAALEKLDVVKPVSFTQTNILTASLPSRRYDLIVISEVLEHLESPQTALSFLRNALADGGRIFINIPINSPSPDHIYLVSTPDEVRGLVERAGFRIVELSLFATQAKPIERALANRISVSAGIIAVAA